MRKILLAFDGSHFSKGALSFARKLNEKQPILLGGIFLPQVNYSALWSYSSGVQTGSSFIPLLEDDETATVNDNIRQFEEYCQAQRIQYVVHKDFYDFALPELKRETRFADLLILGSERFYEQAGPDAPNDYLKEALHEVECPVIVVPEVFDFPSQNILAYDGTATSAYAIKQFAYLLPELAANTTQLIYATEKDIEHLPHHTNIEELATRHYNHITLCKLHANPRKEFASWIDHKEGGILVTGSYGGSVFSNLFHKSFVSDVIRSRRLPVFIAHK
jgi:nucleotide-binding universal stress UspA family protein